MIFASLDACLYSSLGATTSYAPPFVSGVLSPTGTAYGPTAGGVQVCYSVSHVFCVNCILYEIRNDVVF